MTGRTYSITEPHPSVPSSHYMYSGRGGAGNHHRVNPSTITPPATASGPASVAKLPTTSSPYIYSGRGGAGNIHRHNERAIFSFDEELAAQRRMQERAAPVYHVGRGGAGNFVEDAAGVASVHKASSAASTHSGSSAEGSPRGRNSAERVWDKVTRSLSRQ